jgi:two-component system, NtrC family, response regulator HydG
MPELVFLRRGEEMLRVALDRSRVVLGRAETSDIVIPDPDVGPHQAAVLFDGGAAVLEDISGKGTVVSGGRTDRAYLEEGVDIILGQWRAVYRASPPVAATAANGNPQPAADPHRWSTRGPFLGTVRVFDAAPATRAALPSRATPPAREPGLAARMPPLSPAIIGADPAIRSLPESIDRVAATAALVGIFGEPGSGRELLARAIHARGGHTERPFVRVNCRVVGKELLETELFGHETGWVSGPGGPRPGAFDEAAGGTLFLDEVGEFSLNLQEALLRALESREFRRVGATRPVPVAARVVVATNKDLLSATRIGMFREDLYDRLCTAPLMLPPLRRRPGDVPALAEHLVKEFSPHGQPVSITPAALGRLSRHSWPGNIRELRNVVHRALLLRKGQTIDVGELLFDTELVRPGLPAGEFIPGLTLDQMLRQREREIVESALRHFDNNRERVARELGVARSTLFKRLKDWGLTKHDEPDPDVPTPM